MKPKKSDANPGVVARGNVKFSDEQGEWIEEFDLIQLTAEALAGRGHTVQAYDTWLVHRPSGFVLQPLISSLEVKDGGIQTLTTIEISHPQFAPQGLFEFQHSAGDNLRDSLFKGLGHWADVDLVPLLDSLESERKNCTWMEMNRQASPERKALNRRIVLGPVAHLRQQEPPPESEDPEHPFCPCCLFTRSALAFQDWIESDQYCAIRMFACRDESGKTMSDCRVNGIDFEPGAAALREYVETWPPAGFEFRKQYVVLRSLAEPTTV